MEVGQEPADREVVLEDSVRGSDQIRGKARHGEPGQVKPFREWATGTELHRDSGELRQVERVIDREEGRYRERITDQAGNPVRVVDKSLRDHRDRGAAKRRKPTDPAA